MVYHVLNRSHSRKRLFWSEKDYLALLKVFSEAHVRWPGVRILSLCIMPNHWHLVVSPKRDGELSEFMRWVTQTHTQRWRHSKNTVGYGALYQGRFKSFVVEADEHFLVLCRYVEQNALRAKLVERAEDWRWGSAWIRRRGDKVLRSLLSEWPVDRPANWVGLLNERQDEAQCKAVQESMKRNRPFGRIEWVEDVSRQLGLGHTLRPPGRPRKAGKR